jgi:hypothetical protein
MSDWLKVCLSILVGASVLSILLKTPEAFSRLLFLVCFGLAAFFIGRFLLVALGAF